METPTWTYICRMMIWFIFPIGNPLLGDSIKGILDFWRCPWNKSKTKQQVYGGKQQHSGDPMVTEKFMGDISKMDWAGTWLIAFCCLVGYSWVFHRLGGNRWRWNQQRGSSPSDRDPILSPSVRRGPGAWKILPGVFSTKGMAKCHSTTWRNGP